jgi:uncharacterized protein
MKMLLRRIDAWRLVYLGLLVSPALIVFVLGLVWLWQAERVWLWLLGFAASGAFAWGLQRWLGWRNREWLAEAETGPNPDWAASADAVWQQVDELARSCEPADWPLDDAGRVLALGRRTIETVARGYHPDVDEPALELTVPHALMIVERAARDLRAEITDHIPFSHRLKIGDLIRAQRWTATAEHAFNVYRAGRMVFNPINALIGEAWRHLRDRSFGLARVELHRWLLRVFVRKVGYYAIDLYSGRLPLSDTHDSEGPTARSQIDRVTASEQAGSAETEPLRIVVLGRANAGKSSLINALFGRLTTAADALPDTTRTIVPFVLEREGLTRALVFDTPGCDTARFDTRRIERAVLDADLVLWVSAVHRPDRQTERAVLDRLRSALQKRPNRRPAPLLVAASWIDQLRPAAEWQPPYDLADPLRPKAVHIRGAVEALARDLELDLDRVVPVCLAEGRTYNVEDGLWSTILAQREGALRARLLRCLEARRREENWRLLRRQLAATGRLLRGLPKKLMNRNEA